MKNGMHKDYAFGLKVIYFMNSYGFTCCTIQNGKTKHTHKKNQLTKNPIHTWIRVRKLVLREKVQIAPKKMMNTKKKVMMRIDTHKNSLLTNFVAIKTDECAPIYSTNQHNILWVWLLNSIYLCVFFVNEKFDQLN